MAASTALINDITTSLGGNLIDVELTQEDFDYALDKAIRTFKQRGNNNYDRKFYSLPVVAGTVTYTLPSAENIDTIIKIIKPRSALSNTTDPFSIDIINQFFGYRYNSGSDLMSYELGLQYLDNIAIYLAEDTDFIWKKRNNEFTLLKTPKVTESWFLECYADMSDAEYEELIWIRNFTIAECKIILGRAYRKFSSLTTTTGELSLDGDRLVEEGKEEQTQLIENIDDYVDGDVTGSVMIIG